MWSDRPSVCVSVLTRSVCRRGSMLCSNGKRKNGWEQIILKYFSTDLKSYLPHELNINNIELEIGCPGMLGFLLDIYRFYQ